MMYTIGTFVFFFFKQKTAYEMRISDWSSDVCSSDLNHNDYTFYGGLIIVSIIIPVIIYWVISSNNLIQNRHNTPQTQTTPPPEIGRASGRERVCRYV